MRSLSLILIFAYALMCQHGIGHADLELCHDACGESEGLNTATDGMIQLVAAGCDAACCAAHDCNHAHYHASSASLQIKTEQRQIAAPTGVLVAVLTNEHFDKSLRCETISPGCSSPTYLRNLSLRI